MLVIIFGIPNIFGIFSKILFNFFLRTAPGVIEHKKAFLDLEDYLYLEIRVSQLEGQAILKTR